MAYTCWPGLGGCIRAEHSSSNRPHSLMIKTAAGTTSRHTNRQIVRCWSMLLHRARTPGKAAAQEPCNTTHQSHSRLHTAAQHSTAQRNTALAGPRHRHAPVGQLGTRARYSGMPKPAAPARFSTDTDPSFLSCCSWRSHLNKTRWLATSSGLHDKHTTVQPIKQSRQPT